MSTGLRRWLEDARTARHEVSNSPRVTLAESPESAIIGVSRVAAPPCTVAASLISEVASDRRGWSTTITEVVFFCCGEIATTQVQPQLHSVGTKELLNNIGNGQKRPKDRARAKILAAPVGHGTDRSVAP